MICIDRSNMYNPKYALNEEETPTLETFRALLPKPGFETRAVILIPATRNQDLKRFMTAAGCIPVGQEQWNDTNRQSTTFVRWQMTVSDEAILQRVWDEGLRIYEQEQPR